MFKKFLIEYQDIKTRQRETEKEYKFYVCRCFYEFIYYNVNYPEVELATLKNCKRQSHRTDTRFAGSRL